MIENYLKAFKAYDIRWIYGKEIDKKFTYILGTAIWNYILEKFGWNSKFLIWCDVRNQNTEIIDNFVSWIKWTWFDNIFFAKFGNFDENKYPYWICSTSALYYLWQWSFDLWVSITASHNPWEYVWFKFFDKEVELIMTDELKDLFQKYYFDWEYFENILERHVELVDEVQSKKDSLFKFLLKKWEWIQKKYKFVVDFSTWAGTTIEHDFFEQIKDKHEINYINNFPDWLFSSHESDTTTKWNYEQLSQKVRERSADFWIMFDWDVDRIWFVTNSWEVVNCDIITAIIANQVL